jgi:hypothetical protein
LWTTFFLAPPFLDMEPSDPVNYGRSGETTGPVTYHGAGEDP